MVGLELGMEIPINVLLTDSAERARRMHACAINLLNGPVPGTLGRNQGPVEPHS